MAVSILTGRVKFPADKVWQSKQPDGKDYVSLKCDLYSSEGQPTGNDAVVYANVGSAEQSILAAYRKGDPVQLAFDGKKYSIVGSASTLTMANNTTPPPAQEPKSKEATKEKAEKWAQIYADIFNYLSKELPVTTPAEVVGTATSTVFIALTRN
jgi:hypothetical protein